MMDNYVNYNELISSSESVEGENFEPAEYF